MPEKLFCPNGHAWEAEDDDTPCPVCGSAAESLDDGDSSTWDSGIADELPPPPGAAVRPPVVDPGDAVPAIPGYEVRRELGRGGMGVVYEARHVALNRRVALKVIRGFAGRDEVARFRGEAEAVARLQHPNIVQVYEVGEHAGMPYLALEFVDGGSLAVELRRAPLAPRAAAGLVATLARAAQHAHSRGVVHRDLKPANILLVSGGVVSGESSKDTTHHSPLTTHYPKIADFGLAKFADDPGRSRSGLVVGTPAYMSPEQAAGRGDLVGPPADVWALGAILYECLTRRPPFLGATSVETVQQVLTAEPMPAARLAPGVPRDLDTIVLKCLRKEPDQRYRTAGDLADDLTRFLENRPILARRVPWWEQLAKWSRRRPAAAALLVVVVAAGSALAGLGYRHVRATEDYNRELEASNATIRRNNADLERQNEEITRKSRELEVANAATVRERDRAEGNLLEAIGAVDGVLSITGVDRLAQAPHIDPTRAAMLDRALQVCDRLLKGQENNPRLRLFQGLTLQRAGKILTMLQRYDEAENRLDRALAVLREHRTAPQPDTRAADFAKLEALTRLDRGKLFLRTGKPARAREEYAAAEDVLEPFAAGPPDADVVFLLAVGNADLSVIDLDDENPGRAVLHLGRARTRLEELFGRGQDDVAYHGAYAFVLNTLGVAHMQKGETDRAAELFERGVETSRRVLTVLPGHIDYRAELARCLANLGVTLRVQGYYRRAAVPLGEAMAIREELAGQHPGLGRLSLDLCWSYRQTGQLEHSRDDFRAAERWFTKAVEQLTRDANLEKEPHARRLLGDVYQARAQSREQLRQFPEAADDLTRALALVPATQHASLRVQRAGLLVSAGQVATAVKDVESVVADPRSISADVHFDAGVVFARAARTERSDDLARRAVQALTQAARAGHFRDPRRRSLLTAHPDLRALRDRDDFTALLAGVQE